MNRPLAVELFCGRFGWSRGLAAAGFRSIGFDISHEPYHGKVPDHCELVLQDVLTLHGSQFKDARVIVASPPCQNYSYLAMPWSRSKPTGECIACRGTGLNPAGQRHEAICLECEGEGVIHNSKAAKSLRKKWETEGPDNRLFDACFRIQREAIEATPAQRCHECSGSGRMLYNLGPISDCIKCGGKGIIHRYIPLIVENVRGAIPWVGPSKANYGSFHLWGDVEMVGNRIFVGDEWKRGGAGLRVPGRAWKGGDGSWFAVANNTNGHSKNPVHDLTAAQKVPGFRFDGSGRSFQTASVQVMGVVDEMESQRAHADSGSNPDDSQSGTKIGGDWFRDPACHSKHGSRSNARKAASAMIAEIPLKLAAFIGWSYYPKDSQPGVCIYPETLDFQQFWCNLEEEKFVRLTPSPIEDGGKLVGEDLGNPILPVPRLKFNPEGQPDRCVFTR